jgi:hypothetical protein
MTPDISAETWLGAAGCARGSQTWRGTTPAIEATRRHAKGRKVECPGPLGEGKECDEKQGRSSVGHHHVEKPCPSVLAIPVIGDDKDVAGERHAFPAEQKA